MYMFEQQEGVEVRMGLKVDASTPDPSWGGAVNCDRLLITTIRFSPAPHDRGIKRVCWSSTISSNPRHLSPRAYFCAYPLIGFSRPVSELLNYYKLVPLKMGNFATQL